jgi:hypothetical protein
MKTFLEELQSYHEAAMKAIRFLTDLEHERVAAYPEYKQAATLCKFIMEYENKYELLVDPKQYGRFYDSAIEFEMLCNAIYHAIVDDGDIAYVQLTGECPAIIFKHRSEVTIDNAMSESQKRYIEQLNVFKSRYNQPLFHPELSFFDDAYEFIEAVANYERASAERQQKAQAIIQNLSKT